MKLHGFILGLSLFAFQIHAADALALRAEPDQDQDGVSDYDDYCPNTPAGKAVWKKSDAAAGKCKSDWVGCAGQGDPHSTSVPQRPTLFKRISDLWNEGGLPQFSSFDPNQAMLGKGVYHEDKDRLREVQLVSVEMGDDVVGRQRQTQIFDRKNSEGEITSDLALDCLKGIAHVGTGMGCEAPPSILIIDEGKKSLYFDHPGTSYRCSTRTDFHDAVIASGKHVLVYARTSTDSNSGCNVSGPLEVGYFELP